jgi:hypothetical protein
VGPHLCWKEQSGQAAEGLVPLLAAPTRFFSGAFLLGPELQGALFIFLPAEIISTVANKHSLRDFLSGPPNSKTSPCFLAGLVFLEHYSISSLLKHLQ